MLFCKLKLTETGGPVTNIVYDDRHVFVTNVVQSPVTFCHIRTKIKRLVNLAH
jgi:hypothetical protein